jgi:hypothetical protein
MSSTKSILAVCFSIILALTLLSGVFAYQLMDLRAAHERLSGNFDTLNQEHRSLQTSYSNLQQNHTRLQELYATLNESYNLAQTRVSSLESQVSSLQGQIAAFRNQVNNLQSSYQTLQAQYTSAQYSLTTWESLHIGTRLETYYDYVRANVVSLNFQPLGEERWYSYPNYYNLSVQFAADEASHDAGHLYWPSLNAETEYYYYATEYSYQTASKILLDALALANISSLDMGTTKIDKVMRFTSSIVHYEEKLIDHMWFPAETLAFRSGDCTSYSILESALFEMVGIKSAIGFFKNDRGDGHAMVLVHLDEISGYSSWYYSDLTPWGLSSGKWIIIEPQYSSLSQQEQRQDSWMPQWDLVAAAEVPYGP